MLSIDGLAKSIDNGMTKALEDSPIFNEYLYNRDIATITENQTDKKL